MAHDQSVLFPVVIVDTTDAEARAPDRFRERQWMRLPGGAPSTAFIDQIKRLISPKIDRTAGPSASA